MYGTQITKNYKSDLIVDNLSVATPRAILVYHLKHVVCFVLFRFASDSMILGTARRIEAHEVSLAADLFVEI